MRLATRSLIALFLLAAGCSNSQASQQAGATIEGTVIGAGSQALRVEVPGSQKAANTSTAGGFLLTEVPAGTSFLRFSGGGIDATLAIHAVVPAEFRHLEVEVQGREAREHHERTETEFRGTVTAIDGTTKTLTVVDRKVTVTDATEIRQHGNAVGFDAIAVGAFVEVRGTLQADGTVLARALHIEDGDGRDGGQGDDSSFVTLAGTITGVDGLHLTVGGLAVNLTATTEIRRGDAAADASSLAVGDKVLVRGKVEADKSITARSIRVLLPESQDEDFHVAGTVTAVSADAGTFTIGETVIATDAHTEFEGDSLHSLADLKVGDRADAEVVRRADGSLLAKEVRRFTMPPPPPVNGVVAQGTIEAIGAASVTIAGKVFQVNDATVIRRGDARIALADLKLHEAALAFGTLGADGTTITALKIQVAPPSPPPPPQGEVEVRGAIQALGSEPASITVAGKTFAVDGSTVILRGDAAVALSNLKVGEIAEVKGNATMSALVATRIKVESGH